MDIKIAKTLQKGSPLAFKENTICIYGPSGSGKTTGVVEYLKASGKSCVYLDLDGNSAPVVNAGEAVLGKMNYIKLRNDLDRMHVAEFINRAMDTPQLMVCVRHGFMNCGRCRNQGGDQIVVNFDSWKDYDLVVVDSVTIMVKAITLFSTKEAQENNERDLRKIWQRVNILSQTMMHFVRECHPNVIVLSHPLDVRLEYEKVAQTAKHPTRPGMDLVDPRYLPCFGSVPFTRESAKNLSAVIYSNPDSSIVTDQKEPYFANARQEIKSTTIAGALQEILD